MCKNSPPCELGWRDCVPWAPECVVLVIGTRERLSVCCVGDWRSLTLECVLCCDWLLKNDRLCVWVNWVPRTSKCVFCTCDYPPSVCLASRERSTVCFVLNDPRERPGVCSVAVIASCLVMVAFVRAWCVPQWQAQRNTQAREDRDDSQVLQSCLRLGVKMLMLLCLCVPREWRPVTRGCSVQLLLFYVCIVRCFILEFQRF